MVEFHITPEKRCRNTSLCVETSTTCVYTDGSGIDSHVGAAAVILSNPMSMSSAVLQQRTQYMGTEAQSTVYAAELKGILLTLEIIIANASSVVHHFTIFTDNQGALKTLQNPGNTSGQSILVKLLQTLDQAATAGLTIHFRWIPAHRDIPGNEAADRAAKEVANSGTTTSEQDPRHKPNNNSNNTIRSLLTTTKRTIDTALHQDW